MRYFLLAVTAVMFVASQVQADLAGYYPFDNFVPSTPATLQHGLHDDVTDLDNDMSAGGTVWVPDGGISNGAVYFGLISANDEMNNFSNVVLGIVDDVSYSFWVNPDSLPGSPAEAEVIIRTRANGTGLQYAALGDENRLYLQWAIAGVGLRPPRWVPSAHSVMQPGEWTHIVIVFSNDHPCCGADSGIVEVYRNGTTGWGDGDEGPFRVGPDQGHALGNHPAFSNGFQGLLDEVKIFNKALNSGEIISLYHEGLQGLGLTNFAAAAAGAPGSEGPQGPQGKEGPSGSDGAVGANGSAGAAGAQGPQGEAGADADCVPCADVANGAVNLACLVLGENTPSSVAEIQAAALVIVDTLLISTNICEDPCDIGAGIQAAIDAKLNP